MKKPWDSWLAFIVVFAVHTGAIALVWTPSSTTQELVLPSIQGILIPAPPAETVQMPSAAEAPPPLEPPPPEPEKPKTTPKKIEPKAKAKSLVKAPPSEKAITQTEQQQEEAPPPQQVATPTAEENNTPGAPVTPPRVDANNLNNPAPAYPSLSRRLRESGTVLLEILILPDGSVGEIKVKESSGYRRLDDTAIKAVRQWTYIPAKRGDEAIAYWYVQPLEFSLN